MTEQLQPEVTKHSFRQQIWDYMMKNELVNFPLGIYNRTPNFKGANKAAARLIELEEFKNAKIIKINPDKPQDTVRFLALKANKEILVPIPRLRSHLFLHVKPVPGMNKKELRSLSKIYGLMEAGEPLGVDSKIKVDLVIMGSVCVSREGYRLGKGKGFADLEFATMMRMGAVNQDTTVIATVHDCQVLDSLPPTLFKEYDVPVDIIVTPTQTIIVNPRLKKPTGIVWHMLSEKRLESRQVLQQLKEMDEKDGIVVTWKPDDSDDAKEKPQYEAKQRHRSTRPKTRMQIEFSLKLSNISSRARIRDLKDVLQVRGVKPNRIVWQGCRGICYLHFNKLKKKTDLPEQPVQVDSIMANLQDLRIEGVSDDFIIVEPAKPISRIEVTDVSAV
ncbi:methenyltetrahydrofolate synthase domain-containing protein lost isoform X1 [Halictus rubicundus]|uniref:methenyltetrahydrofolate synthase domain-containing protein lost isoform X1 n=2 Tax=Halictus rubicundus TaxID=77578 RepID=UPI004035CF2A